MIRTQYPLSVEEAIRAGKTKLLYIPVAIAFVFQIPYFLVFFGVLRSDSLSPLLSQSFLVNVVGIGAALLWRMAHTSAWKVWAYGQVQDIHRLRQNAEAAQIISPDDSSFAHLEFKSASQRAELAALERRFAEPRTFDAPSEQGLPPTLEYGFSYAIFWFPAIFLALIFLIGGNGMRFPIFPIILIGGIYLAVFLAKYLQNADKPYALRLSTEGFDVRGEGEIPWKAVEDVFLETRRSGKASETYLIWTRNDGAEHHELNLTYVKGNNDAIEQQVYAYWVQWQKRQLRTQV